MKILVAPGNFKGTLTAKGAALAIERGIKKVLPHSEVVLLPLADGGEGTVGALVQATGGRIIPKEITGPLGEKVQAYFGILGPKQPAGEKEKKTIVIEMAAASGLNLVPESKRNPLYTTSYGTGELIKTALDYQPQEIIVGIGDSATTDGGIGMAQVLGVSFRDQKGKELGFGGKELKKLAQINTSGLDSRLKKVEFLVASDVDNPLYGPHGAAFVYAPQKGASPAEVKELDEGLRNYAQIVKKDLGEDIVNIPGAGAAGGLGAGLIVFLKAEVCSGSELVQEMVGLAKQIEEASLVITGEGKIDAQTFRGKVAGAVSKAARTKRVPVFAIGGQVTLEEIPADSDFDRVFSLTDIAGSQELAFREPSFFLEKAVEKALREFKEN